MNEKANDQSDPNHSSTSKIERFRHVAFGIVSFLLIVFVIFELNKGLFGNLFTPLESIVGKDLYQSLFTRLTDPCNKVIFLMLGLILCFLKIPVFKKNPASRPGFIIDSLCILLVVISFGHIIVQTESIFQSFWGTSESLGKRAGAETNIDFIIGGIGLIIILEATRRAIGWTLAFLALAFILYGYFGQSMPSWFFRHSGTSIEKIIGATFLQESGVFSIAAKVMFEFVFAFLIFGALLEATGTTNLIISLAKKWFGSSTGGPAKISVVSSGLMGSLSGSAVANTATTGAITIPLMKRTGFRGEVAGAIEAAASSGGALVPPVMGAGAFMMLEMLMNFEVTLDGEPLSYLQICRCAMIPAILYYFSLFLNVHFYARANLSNPDHVDSQSTNIEDDRQKDEPQAFWIPLTIFVGSIFVLCVALWYSLPIYVASLYAIVSAFICSWLSPKTRMNWQRIVQTIYQTGMGALPLLVAVSAVGIVIGMVGVTGIGDKLPNQIISLASSYGVFVALLLLMLSSLILGMGLPSVVCYLLLVQFIGRSLNEFGIQPVAGHFFVMYFGLMSMVTPPIALAGYTAASIAKSDVMKTSFNAFRFALVGFTLPFIFVYRPELLTITQDGMTAPIWRIAIVTLIAIGGIVPLASALGGALFTPLNWLQRGLLLVSACLALLPSRLYFIEWLPLAPSDVIGLSIFGMIAWLDWKKSHQKA